MFRLTHVSRLTFALLLFAMARASRAQDPAQDSVAIQHVMDDFHDALVAHDGARLGALFIPEGSTWLNVLSDDAYAHEKATKPNASKIRVGNYTTFAQFVSHSPASLDAKHTHIHIASDGTIASVYFDFVFFIGGKEENRGHETWQLVKGADGWRIAAITYSSDPRAP